MKILLQAQLTKHSILFLAEHTDNEFMAICYSACITVLSLFRIKPLFISSVLMSFIRCLASPGHISMPVDSFPGNNTSALLLPLLKTRQVIPVLPGLQWPHQPPGEVEPPGLGCLLSIGLPGPGYPRKRWATAHFFRYCIYRRMAK